MNGIKRYAETRLLTAKTAHVMAAAAAKRDIVACKDILLNIQDQVPCVRMGVGVQIPLAFGFDGRGWAGCQGVAGNVAHSLAHFPFVSRQAPAPSKTYYNLVVNKLGVVFRVWLINPSMAFHHGDPLKSTSEAVASLKDFLLGDLQEEIRRVDGAMLQQAIEARAGGRAGPLF